MEENKVCKCRGRRAATYIPTVEQQDLFFIIISQNRKNDFTIISLINFEIAHSFIFICDH